MYAYITTSCSSESKLCGQLEKRLFDRNYKQACDETKLFFYESFMDV